MQKLQSGWGSAPDHNGGAGACPLPLSLSPPRSEILDPPLEREDVPDATPESEDSSESSSEGATTEPDVEAEPPPRPEVEPRRRHKRKAHRGEYSDFDKWLSPTDDAVPGQAVAPKKCRKTKRLVFDLQSWLEAWNSYLAIRIQTAPKKMLQRVKYQIIAVFCLPGCFGPEVRQVITGRGG